MRQLLRASAILAIATAIGCGAQPISTDENLKATATPEFAAAAEIGRANGVEFRKNPVKVGDAAPAAALSLPDQKGRMVSVRELSIAQDTLLIFYPGEASPEARPIYEWVRRNRAFAAQHSCEVVLINTADGPAANDRVAAVEQLKVAVLADNHAAMARSFGVVQPYTAPALNNVWSIVVGKGGVVLSAEPGLPATTDLVTTLKVKPRPQGGFGVFDILKE